LQEGTALCLSGGGYRAMLFHTGVLWQFNDTGLLPKLKRISNVSGGSITAGVLAMNWSNLNFQNDIATNFKNEVVLPIKRLASRTIDVSSVVTGTMWFGSIGDKIADVYRNVLYCISLLQDMNNNLCKSQSSPYSIMEVG
jgi:NTE family protein